MSRISVRHRLVNLLGGVLIAAVTICGAAPAQAATSLSTRDSADAAAGWLARQITGGERFEAEFGGVDLISRLRGLQQPAGRFSDRSPFGDFSNIFTQSFALLALDRAAAGASPASSSFLVAARCAGGGYPLLFAQPTCVSEVDTTATAVQALTAVGRHADATVSLRWLVSVQHADGGFGVPSAINTGLAGQALRAGGPHRRRSGPAWRGCEHRRLL